MSIPFQLALGNDVPKTTFTNSGRFFSSDPQYLDIQGGQPGDVLTTDGSANLRWAAVTGGTGGGPVAWDDVTGKPATFPPAAHVHPIVDVTDLQAALDAKAPLVHTHVITDTIGLQAALGSKEPVIAVGTTAQYWRGDKTWATLPAGGSGTVTSVAAGTGLVASPSPIVGAGTLSLSVPVSIANGGTGGITAPAALANLGGISGNQTITLSGDLSGSGTTAIAAQIVANAVGTTEIANSNVTYPKIQNVTGARLLGNPTGSAAAPAEISLGTNLSFAGNVLNATGGGGSGTVTSVAAGTGLAASPSPIVGAGTISLSTPVSVANGGTGASSLTQYTTLVGNNSSLNLILPGANGTIYASNGAAAMPGFRTLTALLDILAGTAAQGQILYRGSTIWGILAPGTAGQFLRTGGAAANPTWATPAGAGTVTSVAAGTGLTASPSPIVGAGTISLTVPVSVANGGSGVTTAAAAPWVDVAGDTMTGNLVLSTGAGVPAVYLRNTISGTADNNGFEVSHDGVDTYLWNYENGKISFGTNNAEHMVLNGGLATFNGTGFTTPNVVYGSAHSFGFGYGTVGGYAANAVISVNNGGAAYPLAAANSDRRMKDDIAPSTLDCLDTVLRLQLRQFRWRDIPDPARLQEATTREDAPLVRVGLIAQEIAELFPDGVQQGDDFEDKLGLVWGLDQNVMIAALIGAVQQLHAKIEQAP